MLVWYMLSSCHTPVLYQNG